MGVVLCEGVAEAAPVKFPDGIVVTMRLATSVDQDEVEREAADILKMFVTGGTALEEFGVPVKAHDGTTDFETTFGLAQYLTTALMFERVVTGWDHVQAEDWSPAPLNRKWIGRFLLDAKYRRVFETKAYETIHKVVSEGNA
jgi:hypothetical protein